MIDKSSFNPSIKDNGKNVRIVNPNPEGQSVPHEDMYIYASLKAFQKSKSILTSTNEGIKKEEQGNNNSIELIAPQQSFETVDKQKLFKTKPNLTTDWTEIGGPLKPTGSDFEGFGITNIDIEIKSQTTPIVNIDFVDVRGATLFEQGSCSPYGLFFNLPYPIFELTLKGYYGRPVKYYLNLMSFTCKFNSSNGNMECRGKFIGYTFAFLTDMIMGYIIASQYLNESEYKPQQILREKYSDTKKNYKLQGLTVEEPETLPTPWCDNPNISNSSHCVTILDLINLIERFEKEPKQRIIDSPEYYQLQKLNELNNKLLAYQKEINGLITKEGIKEYLKNNILEETDITKINSIKEILKSYFDKIKGSFLISIKDILSLEITSKNTNNKLYGSNYVTLLSTGFNISYIDSKTNNGEDNILYDKLYIDLNKEEFQYGILDDKQYRNSKEKKDNNNNPIYYINFQILLDNIQGELNKIKTEIDDLKDVLNKQINDVFTQTIGFKPTIRNIFTVILCNTDAFIQILLDLQVKAEEYHQTNTKNNSKFISGNNNIYPWPTYIQPDFTPQNTGLSSPQGTKEVYPGKDFPDWVECRFVEDFLKAYTRLQSELEISKGQVEGKSGFDNYVPINPLESPIWKPQTKISYTDVESKDDIYKLIGQRAFINLDHTYFSPIRMTPDMLDMPLGVDKNDTNWNPIKNTDTNKENIPSLLGSIEAWNLLNSKDGENIGKSLNLLLNESNSSQFVSEVIKKLELKTEKASDLSKITSVKPTTTSLSGKNYGFDWNDEYYVLDVGDDGIKLNEVTIHANPYKMGVENLFDIIEAPNGIPKLDDTARLREIEITNEKLLKQIGTYSNELTKQTESLSFGTYELTNAEGYDKIKDNINDITLNKNSKSGWFINTLDQPQHFITLAMSNLDSGKLTDWYTDTNINGLSVSNMGLLSYWDYDYNNETYGISFLTEDNNQKDIWVPNLSKLRGFDGLNENILPTSNVDEADNSLGLATPLITTPLWLDNINNFRTNANGSNLNVTNNWGVPYNADQIEKRNLAYLFLHTLKTTPFITRYLSDDGYLWNKGEKLPDDAQKNRGSSSDPSLVQSLRGFMISGGMTKVPKAWLLTLGSQLWRWKMFVGKRSDGKWNKPLTCKNCAEGDKPNGFDPLAQPGFVYYDANNNFQARKKNNSLPNIDRNDVTYYISNIYGVNTTNPQNILQKSVFSNEYQGRQKGQKLEGGETNNTVYASFRYYNIYRDNLNDDLKSNLLFADKKNEVKEYSWPQLWIAPHHIPYVNPEIFYDNEDGASSGFVTVFENTLGYLDYQTIMPETYKHDEYYDNEKIFGNSQPTNTKRTRKFDGNLGMVFQYIPDEIKDKIVQKFEEWCDSNEWKTILSVIDPVNFPSTSTDNLFTTYTTSKEISNQILGKNSGYALVPKDNSETLKKLLTDEYWLLSSTPKIWYGIGDDTQKDKPSQLPLKDEYTSKSNQFNNSFLVSKKLLETYLTSFYNEFKQQKGEREKEVNDSQLKNNTNNNSILEDEDIKLSIYRTFKSISDKWISASEKGKSFFNMISKPGKCNNNYQYSNVTNNNNNNNNNNVEISTNKTLANNFQYVNRAMGDIGNEAVIDVLKLKDIRDNPKLSLYQYITNLLTQNEYMFFPLPAYVNFSHVGLDNEVLKDMFRPVNDFDNIGCGPIFLSMYVGGGSRQLNLSSFKTNCTIDQNILNNIQDDSFSLTQFSDLPTEFTKENDNTKTTAFEVLYGIENQNHFKNIQLDQSEFKETAESLMVIEKLSQQGGSDRTTKGQNLNAAYLTRSYTCEIESFGNMMIQPMMYFDLKGVPMFSGSYLITEVRHSFKPNNATTIFKGVRQPRMTLPLVTDVSAAMSYLFKDAKSSGTGQSLSSFSQNTDKTKSPSGLNIYQPIDKEITKLFVNPVDCEYQPKITSPMYRNKTGSYHGGLDIGFSNKKDGNKAPVYAAYDGVVQLVGAAGGFGTPPNGGRVVIRHGLNDGTDTFPDQHYYHFVYGHVNPKTGLKPNDIVKKGDLIGEAVFPAGESGGLHLHLTVLRLTSPNYECKSPNERDCYGKIDPSPFLNQNNKCIKGIETPTYSSDNDSGLVPEGSTNQKGTKSNEKAKIDNISYRLGYLGKI